jgi:predicted amidophosphoribosyltransferase
MIIARIQILSQAEIDRRRQIVNEREACPVCGHKMTFIPLNCAEEGLPTVIEKIHCPDCALVLPDGIHRLH